MDFSGAFPSITNLDMSDLPGEFGRTVNYTYRQEFPAMFTRFPTATLLSLTSCRNLPDILVELTARVGSVGEQSGR